MKTLIIFSIILFLSIHSFGQGYYGMIKVDSNLWVDQTEITNNEYRQFVSWVKDSIAKTILFEAGKHEYYKIDSTKGTKIINSNTPINYSDTSVVNTLYNSNKFYYDEQRFYGSWDVNTIFLNYSYINDKNERVEINVYPDTSNFYHILPSGDSIKDKSLTDVYFWHPAFDDYPVVNITYQQAMAFCNWRSKLYNNWNLQNGSKRPMVIYALPSEKEWITISKYVFGSNPYQLKSKKDLKKSKSSENLISGISSGVAEIMIDKKVVTGCYINISSLVYKGIYLNHNPDIPTSWMGFRCIARQIKQ